MGFNPSSSSLTCDLKYCGSGRAEEYSREYARGLFPRHSTISRERFLIRLMTAASTRVFTRGKSLISLARKERTQARSLAVRSIGLANTRLLAIVVARSSERQRGKGVTDAHAVYALISEINER